MTKANEIWGVRLKAAREEAGLSQKVLGIAAGLDPFVASTRINRYELGVHKADFQISAALARILDVPPGYFYTDNNQLAKLMVAYHRLSARKKATLLKSIEALLH